MLVLLRHGESQFNEEGRFSGWVDCPLTAKGIRQAREAGQILRGAAVGFDVCFTSVLSRAVNTAEVVLNELKQTEVPVIKTWKLNERHYGMLEGVVRDKVLEQYGSEQVEAWRNAAGAVPPPLPADDFRHPCYKAVYQDVAPNLLPSTECLRDAFRRVIGFFEQEIRPLVESGRDVLIVSHGNPVRALVARLEGSPPDEIPLIDIPNASPIFYSADRNIWHRHCCETGKLAEAALVN